MPRISEFYGIVIEMYFRDHPPPHFHARYGGDEAVIAIGHRRTHSRFSTWAGAAARARMDADAPGRTGRQLGSRPRPPGAGRDRAAAVMELVRIIDVRALEGHSLRLWFTNGVVKDVDLSEALTGGGIFEEIHRDRDVFEQVRVNPESRTIEWPGGVDLDPDVLYGTFEPVDGIRITRRVVNEPAVP